MTEWISVKDRLPEEDSRVLVRYEDGWIDIDICISLTVGGEWMNMNYIPFGDRCEITHWMPMPPLP